MQLPQPTKEHAWLKRFVGEWTHSCEMQCAPDQPPVKLTGTERARAVGDIWVVAEGEGRMPMGGTAYTCLTLGYDPAKGRIVATWYGSMMTHLWVYERGAIDFAANRLTLEASGPSFCADGKMEEGKTANYREVIEFQSDDARTFTSSVQGPDGSWTPMMQLHYKRVK